MIHSYLCDSFGNFSSLRPHFPIFILLVRWAPYRTEDPLFRFTEAQRIWRMCVIIIGNKNSNICWLFFQHKIPSVKRDFILMSNRHISEAKSRAKCIKKQGSLLHLNHFINFYAEKFTISAANQQIVWFCYIVIYFCYLVKIIRHSSRG